MHISKNLNFIYFDTKYYQWKQNQKLVLRLFITWNSLSSYPTFKTADRREKNEQLFHTHNLTSCVFQDCVTNPARCTPNLHPQDSYRKCPTVTS